MIHIIGFISWYFIFIFLIPYFIKVKYNFGHLKYYLPVLDLIANIFSVASTRKIQIFKDLYSLSPNNVISFLSTNFINLLALIGVTWNGIDIAMKRKSIKIGIMVTVFMYVITYLLPTQGIPYIVHNLQKKIDKYFNIDYNVDKIDIFGYLAGIIFIVILYLFEGFVIRKYLNFMSK